MKTSAPLKAMKLIAPSKIITHPAMKNDNIQKWYYRHVFRKNKKGGNDNKKFEIDDIYSGRIKKHDRSENGSWRPTMIVTPLGLNCSQCMCLQVS